jgi:hypothetical protein
MLLLDFVDDSIDRPSDELQERGSASNGDQSEGMKGPIEGRPDFFSIPPGILAVVRSLAIAPHRRTENLDFLRQVANQGEYAPGFLEAQSRGQNLLLDHDRERIRDIAMAGLQRPGRRSSLDEVGFTQFFAGHLEKKKLVAFRRDRVWMACE